MIRIVYGEKIEFMSEVSKTAITYYGKEYICKDFEDEATAEKLKSAVESKPTLKSDIVKFLSDMSVVAKTTDTVTNLSIKMDEYLKTSNYRYDIKPIKIEPILKK